MVKKLSPVIKVISENCTNCHACVHVCPSRFCNDFSEGYAKVNPDLCIGCGSCLRACTHDARQMIDDFDDFMKGIQKNERLVAIVAPAIAANYPDNFLRFNGFLKSLGVEAFFDTSFGAELTVKSYLEHVIKNKPKMVIAQPCPAIVSFIEIFYPEMLKYLAPADSPMMHTMKMVKEYFPKYKNHKFIIVSPCLAKRREFDEVGIGDYNVTIKSLTQYIEENNINLNKYPEVDFDNPPAERAVLFSTPGGLMRTAEREAPEIVHKTRKIEGIHSIYAYLIKLPEMVKRGFNPLLIDCLNCEKGCNGGPGTLNIEKPLDEIEFYIEQRNKKMRKRYGTPEAKDDKKAKKKLSKIIDKYWKTGLYDRKYEDRSGNYQIRQPSEEELEKILLSMNKTNDEDFLNCTYCGYARCRNMAVAIFNNLNVPENCIYFKQALLNKAGSQRKIVAENISKAVQEMEEISDSFIKISSEFISLTKSIENQVVSIEESNSIITNMVESTKEAAKIIDSKKHLADDLNTDTSNGTKQVKNTNKTIYDITKSIGDVQDTINLIDDISARTNMLAMNAAIEAANAGTAGRGFAVVAGEIRRLAESTSNNSAKISQTLKGMIENIEIALSASETSEKVLKKINNGVDDFTKVLYNISDTMNELSGGSSEILTMLDNLSDITNSVKKDSDSMKSEFSEVKSVVETVKNISTNILEGVNRLADDMDKMKAD